MQIMNKRSSGHRNEDLPRSHRFQQKRASIFLCVLEVTHSKTPRPPFFFFLPNGRARDPAKLQTHNLA